MALVAFLHDLGAQITGQLVIERGDERVFQGETVDDVPEAVFQEFTQKRRLWLTGVSCQSVISRSMSAGMFRSVYVTLSPPLFVMPCSFSLIPCTFSCVDALLQCSYTILDFEGI